MIGLGITNLPLVSFLLFSGAKSVTVRDLKKDESDPFVILAKNDGAKVLLGAQYLENLDEDLIIRSPVIRPDIEAFRKAQAAGSEITCDTELFLRFCPIKTVAVTGSDGKTTTTTLISKILEKEGFTVFLGGNIGKAMLPYLAKINDESGVAVMELSSFQLMNCRYSPNIAIITNLSENHLDWHHGMEEYLAAKENILRHQSASDRAILNFDNAYTANLHSEAETVYFSRKSPDLFFAPSQEPKVYVENDQVILQKDGTKTAILAISDILLPGLHNLENYMTAISAVFDMVSPEAIRDVAKSFGGVEHRIELVRELGGVRFYNSSIDSSPARSTAALRSFEQKVVMIAGGYDKNLDYTALGDEICQRCRMVILCGATSEKIRTATQNSPLYREGYPQIHSCSTLDEAVKLAHRLTKDGDVVILSPASASFDQFKNFEERGKYFKKLVLEL